MKPLVIYHKDCADGFGAAFAAWLALGDEAEYEPHQHGELFDWNAACAPIDVEGRIVYILDFSFPKTVMDWMLKKASKVVWLDHHKTAFELYGLAQNTDPTDCIDNLDCGVSENHYVCLNNLKSGAMLAWEYFHPGKEVPMLIKHIDDYDRWQFKLEGTKEFNKALWSYAPWSFKQWKNLFPEDAPTLRNWKIEDLKKEGAAILRAHEQNVLAVVNGASRECSFDKTLGYEPQFKTEHWQDNLEGLAANCPPHLYSDVGHELANRSGTYGLAWHLDKDGRCKCSLRSNGDYDVSAIAKVFGGGGHKNAAGFEVPIETLLGWLK